MYSLKRFLILIIASVIIVSAVTAQTQQRREMTVEESYLQEMIELMIIRETARSNTREQKFISLEYIGEAISRGNTNDEIRQTLEFLSLEGTRIQARENNRLVNNFPDVRRRAIMYLGQLGTEEAKNSLINVIQSGETEPLVLMETIRALGNIGINNNNEAVSNIVFAYRRFETLNPDNLMALAIIDSFEKFARNEGGLSTDALQLLIRISEGVYVTPVRERARQLIADLRTMGR